MIEDAKMRRVLWLAACTMTSSMAWVAAANSATAATPVPPGIWLWDDGRAAVQFHPCGDALCGRIVWLRQEAAANASPLLDTKNPDPALRGRRVCGLDYITDVKKTSGGDWKNGRVYDFNGGASYSLDIDSVDTHKVRMRGYKGVRLLGATLTLVPARADLSLCDAANRVASK